MKYKNIQKKVFEDIKHIVEQGNEYWLAIELMPLLGYKDWRNFNSVIDKAIISANNSYPNQNLWGVEVTTPINSGRGKTEMAEDYRLTRYACYLIAQNGDSKKEVIALAQTDAELKRDNVDNEYTANYVQYEVGKKVRNTIKELGGTIPEDLSTPDKSLKELEKKYQINVINKRSGIINMELIIWQKLMKKK